MTTNETPARGGRPETDADALDRTAAGTAETDMTSGVDDPREPDSLDGYGATAEGITDGASSAEAGAYGAENDANREGSDLGAGASQNDSSLSGSLRTPRSPV